MQSGSNIDTPLFERWMPTSRQPQQSGNARVWQVRDRDNQYPGLLALKFLTRVDRRARFAQEVRALQSLSQIDSPHPNIIPLLYAEVSDEDSSPSYLITPWLEGGDARQKVLEQGIFKGRIREAVEAILPIVSAVDFLHKQALSESGYIAHRDIKPANILYDLNERPVLTDFGCAYFDERLTQSNEVVGSLGYAAPELLSGRYEEDLRPADVYSLGAVLYAYVAGDNPPAKGKLSDTEFSLTLCLNSNKFIEIQRLINWCTDSDPKARPSVQRLIEELQIFSHQTTSLSSAVFAAHSNDSVEILLDQLKYDPEIQAVVSSAENVQALKQQAKSIATSLRDNLLSHFAILNLRENYSEVLDIKDHLSSLSETGVRTIGELGFRRAMTEQGFSKSLLSHPRVAPFLAITLNGGWGGQVSIKPRSHFSQTLPSFTIGFMCFITKDAKLGILVHLSVFGAGHLADWQVEPICFVASPYSPKWDRDTASIADKFACTLMEALKWGLLIHRSGQPFPVAWDKVTSAPVELQSKAYKKLLFSNQAFEVWPDVSNGVSVRHDGQIALHPGSGIILLSPASGELKELKGDLIFAHPTWAPHTNRLLTANSTSTSNGISWGEVSVINLQESSSCLLHHFGNRGVRRVCWSQDEASAFIAVGPIGHMEPSAIMSASLSSNNLYNVYSGEEQEGLDFPITSPDGKYLYFVSSGKNAGIWRIHLYEPKETKKVISGRFAFPSISWDGSRIAYINYEDGEWPDHGVYVLNLSNGNTHKVTTGSHHTAWMPDNSQIICGRHVKQGDKSLMTLWAIPIHFKK